MRRAAGSGDAARSALEDILAAYWYPLYAWARRRGLSPEDAADGVQSFMEKVCEKNLMASADEQRGRLRAWLLTCFARHLGGEEQRARAQKRGGGALHLSIDWQGAESVYLAEPALLESPEALYARAWAVSLMEEALLRLTSSYQETGRNALCEALLPALESPLPDTTYADVAGRLGMSPGSVRSAAVRMRRRYRSILLELASARLGITCEAALEEELRALLAGKS